MSKHNIQVAQVYWISKVNCHVLIKEIVEPGYWNIRTSDLDGNNKGCEDMCTHVYILENGTLKPDYMAVRQFDKDLEELLNGD
jgi:hypothetical protein